MPAREVSGRFARNSFQRKRTHLPRTFSTVPASASKTLKVGDGLTWIRRPFLQPLTSGSKMHPELQELAWTLVCPDCRHKGLGVAGESFTCESCRAQYQPLHGVPFCGDAPTARAAFETALDHVDPDSHTADEIAKANAVYHNVAAGTYDADNRAVRAISDVGDTRIRELLRSLRDQGIEGPVVDFGTGTGHLLELVAGILSPRLGLDVSGGMLSQAVQKGLPVLLADCRHAPIASGTAGVVVAHSFLHHFKDPEQILDEMVRVLRPHGWLVVDWEPNSGSRPRAIARFAAWLIHPELWFRSMPHTQSDRVRKVNELAEYHEVMNPGLNAERLAAYLKQRGCDEVRVIYHSNCPSALRPTVSVKSRIRALLDGRWPTARSSAAHFLLMARATQRPELGQ
jgi:ubiquinone/menaquinone biosynthesis C-methylase UbiE